MKSLHPMDSEKAKPSESPNAAYQLAIQSHYDELDRIDEMINVAAADGKFDIEFDLANYLVDGILALYDERGFYTRAVSIMVRGNTHKVKIAWHNHPTNP